MKLETRGRSVREVSCIWRGRHVTIRGNLFVLALGALFTPALLLRSANQSFPEGLGNRSGMLGRNLMTHVSDLVSVRFGSQRGALNDRLNHGLSLNDFYIQDGLKLGNIHAHPIDLSGQTPEASDSREPAGSALFGTIVEDFPHLQNRVTPKTGSQDEVSWEYRYPDELWMRGRMLIDRFADSLRHTCEVSVHEPSGMLNPTHACGTCRFGDDPATSVLDRNNRIHDLDNVYVVDASFFPSSGGINPSLTIVANSLRVSTLMAQS